jgi:hypothetical protein
VRTTIENRPDDDDDEVGDLRRPGELTRTPTVFCDDSPSNFTADGFYKTPEQKNVISTDQHNVQAA